jgi:AcrR family transcriptional regulator
MASTAPPSAAISSPFPTADQREAERTRKRDAILLAAVRMFNERGFHATSLDDVAASLGVTKPVVYHYLGNKDQVLFECVAIGLAQLREAADRSRATPGTGIDRLRLFLERYAEVIMGDFGRCTVRTGEELLSPASRDRVLEMKRSVNAELRTMIDGAIADGSAVVPDPQLATFTVAGALNWSGRWHRPDGRLSAGDVARRMVDTLLVGFLPR